MSRDVQANLWDSYMEGLGDTAGKDTSVRYSSFLYAHASIHTYTNFSFSFLKFIILCAE